MIGCIGASWVGAYRWLDLKENTYAYVVLPEDLLKISKGPYPLFMAVRGPYPVLHVSMSIRSTNDPVINREVYEIGDLEPTTPASCGMYRRSQDRGYTRFVSSGELATSKKFSISSGRTAEHIRDLALAVYHSRMANLPSRPCRGRKKSSRHPFARCAFKTHTARPMWNGLKGDLVPVCTVKFRGSAFPFPPSGV